MAPTIVFVPGLWEGPSVFEQVANQLRSAGFETDTATLKSTGTKSPGNPSMHDDIAAIRTVIGNHVEADKEVVLVLHSAGGFLGSGAIEDLEAKKRAAAGKKGGVTKIIFLAGGIGPKGFEHKPRPFMEFDEAMSTMTCKDARENLLHDVPEPDKWLAVMQHQPATEWDGTITYTGWEYVPSVYVVAKNDKLLPADFQRQLAGLAGAEIKEIESGHMLMLVKPGEVADIVQAEA